MPLIDHFVRDIDLEETRIWNLKLASFPRVDPSTAEGLAAMRKSRFGSPPSADHRVEDRIIGDQSPVRIRIIRPEGTPRAVMMSAHAGGWCGGCAEDDDAVNDILAARNGIATVAFDYRLAPENPYPAGLEDAVIAALWLAEHAVSEFGTARLIAAGSSAGAHLTSQMLLRLRDESPHVLASFIGTILTYGVYDVSETPSVRHAPDDTPLLTRSGSIQVRTHAFGHLDMEARRDPSVSSLYADLHGLPPALFSVGTLDPMFDDSVFMAARWQAAGNIADLDIWPECTHGFPVLSTPKIKELFIERLSSWLEQRLQS